MFSNPGMVPAPSGHQLGSEPQSHLPARCGEHPAQTFGKLLAFGVAHHPEEVPGVVDLASLPRCSLEVAGYGRLEAPVVVGDHQLHADEGRAFGESRAGMVEIPTTYRVAGSRTKRKEGI
jgi:hypothetical protein